MARGVPIGGGGEGSGPGGPLQDVYAPIIQQHGLKVDVEDTLVAGFRRIGLTFTVDHPEAGKLKLGTFYVTNKEARRLGDQLERAVKLGNPED